MLQVVIFCGNTTQLNVIYIDRQIRAFGAETLANINLITLSVNFRELSSSLGAHFPTFYAEWNSIRIIHRNSNNIL